jgi:hypothetical protein
MNYLDIQVHPNFDGLPPSVHGGLVHLTNNAAGLLTLVSALGIVVSILLMVVASWTGSRELSDRAKGGLLLSVVAMGILYLGLAVANYTGALFS